MGAGRRMGPGRARAAAKTSIRMGSLSGGTGMPQNSRLLPLWPVAFVAAAESGGTPVGCTIPRPCSSYTPPMP
jgi:hypothetical protein